VSPRNPIKAAVEVDSTVDHECNLYCREGLHCEVFWSPFRLPDDTVALIQDGQRIDIARMEEAKEAPAVCPDAPEDGEYAFRYLIWTRGAYPL
jgi:hypothetical protein